MAEFSPRRPVPPARLFGLIFVVAFVLLLAILAAVKFLGRDEGPTIALVPYPTRLPTSVPTTAPSTNPLTGLSAEEEQELTRAYESSQRQLRDLVRKRYLRIDGTDYRMKPAYWQAMSPEQKRELVTACYIVNGATTTRVLADRGTAVLGEWTAGEEKPKIYE